MFELYPYGIVLLDADGRILEVNRAARALLGAIYPDGHRGATCCDLFGCRADSGPLGGLCLTELADRSSSPLAEMRLDLPAGSATSAVWVTAAHFESESAKFLLQLRAGDSRDRRRWRTPHWSPPQQLEIFTLGRTLVNGPDGSVGSAWLHQRAGELLKYLICERSRPVQAEEIAETLWPGGDQRVVNNVRHFIHALRAQLEPHRAKRAPSAFVLSGPGGYRLNPETVVIDADHFERGVRSGLKCFARDEADAADVHLREAIRLYGGDFLAEERYATWAYMERDRLRDLASDALSVLADIRLLRADPQGASVHLDRLADMHPFDPQVQKRAITLALGLGRHTVARKRYKELERRLFTEFGSEPSFSLADLLHEAESEEQAP